MKRSFSKSFIWFKIGPNSFTIKLCNAIIPNTMTQTNKMTGRLFALLSKNNEGPWGGFDNLLVRRAIIKVVGYRMIAGCIHMFTEPRTDVGNPVRRTNIVSGR